MQLRNHPLMSYGGMPNWPPIWTWIGGEENKHPRGEIGILKEVRLSKVEPSNRFFLIIEYDEAAYIGSLSFDDPSFCRQISKLLIDHCGYSIRDIGGLDVGQTP
jgi:hypothetical protein